MSMRKKQKRIVRILALALALLIVLGTVASIVFSSARGEEGAPLDACLLEMELLEDAQALQVRQRLLYTNRTGQALDHVEFSIYANMFRRLSALPYEADTLGQVLHVGYAPGGAEFSRVLVDGEAANWGMIDEEELFMRVDCALEQGQQCEFVFEYTLLLTQNAASLGVGETDWRLRGFYVQPLRYEDGAFVATSPLQHANYVYAGRADYTLSVSLPERYVLAGPGEIHAQDNGDGTRTWNLSASGLRELCVSLGMRWREYEGHTQNGTRVRLLSSGRGDAREALETALETLNLYESWFGTLAWDVTIAQSDYALGALSLQGLIWLQEDALTDAMQMRRALAKQYFGWAAYSMPTQDAWLSDSISEYVAYLALESAQGESAFLEAMNRSVLPEAQFTLPGGLEITSDATLFTQSEYDTVVRGRGALVFHELRVAMELEPMLAGLKRFYEKGFRDGGKIVKFLG